MAEHCNAECRLCWTALAECRGAFIGSMSVTNNKKFSNMDCRNLEPADLNKFCLYWTNVRTPEGELNFIDRCGYMATVDSFVFVAEQINTPFTR